MVTADGAEMNYIPQLGGAVDDPPEIVCLSRLRWDFAGQRAQHLMSRSARERRVFFVEEPVFGATVPGLNIRRGDCGVFVVTPHMCEGADDAEARPVSSYQPGRPLNGTHLEQQHRRHYQCAADHLHRLELLAE